MAVLMWHRQTPHDEVIVADAGNGLRAEVWPARGVWGWVVWNPANGHWRGHGDAPSIAAAQEAARRHVGYEIGQQTTTNYPEA